VIAAKVNGGIPDDKIGLAIGNIKPTKAAEIKADIYPYNKLFFTEIRSLYYF